MGYHGRDWRKEKIEYTKTGPDSDRDVFPSCIQNTRHVSGCKLVLQPPQLAEHFQLPSPTKESLAAALKLTPAHHQALPHLLPSTHAQSLCLSLFSHPHAPATWPHLPSFSSQCVSTMRRNGRDRDHLQDSSHTRPTPFYLHSGGCVRQTAQQIQLAAVSARRLEEFYQT